MYRRDTLSDANFNSLLTEAYELSECLPQPDEYKHHYLYFRNLSFQQFIYQADLNYSSIARMHIFFGELPHGSSIEQSFLDEFGMSSQDYILLSYFIAVTFHAMNKPYLEFDQLVNLSNVIGEQHVRKGLNCFSVDIITLPRFFDKYSRIQSSWMQLYEQTAFTRAPLIRSGNTYTCVHPKILNRAIEHLVFDRLKNRDPDVFRRYFGTRFEQYVNQGLQYSGNVCFDESEVKRHIPEGRKCTDFLFTNINGSVFIECKAVDTPPLAMASGDPNLIADKVKGTVITAIEQATSLNEHLLEQPADGTCLPEYSANSYLLVVTYRELYLGSGKSFYETIAGNKLDKVLNKYNPQAQISLENIHFIGIKEFEFLVAALKRDQLTLLDFMQQMATDISDIENNIFDATQYIAKIAPNGLVPEYLTSIMDQYENRAEEILRLADAR